MRFKNESRNLLKIKTEVLLIEQENKANLKKIANLKDKLKSETTHKRLNYKNTKYSMQIFKRPDLDDVYFSDDLKLLKTLINSLNLIYNEYFISRNEV